MRTKKEIVRLIDEELEAMRENRDCVFCLDKAKLSKVGSCCTPCVLWDIFDPKDIESNCYILMDCFVEGWPEYSNQFKIDILLQTRYQLTGSFDGWAK